jgi:hypothetical protein
MVSKRRFMIVYSDRGRRAQGGEERDGEQGKREFRVARGKWRFVAVLVAG